MAQRVRYVCERLGPYARPHRSWLTSGTLAALLVVACRLAFPWPLRGIIELLFASGRRTGPLLNAIPGWIDPVIFLAVSFLLIAIIQGGAELVQRFSFARFAVRAVHDARAAAVASVLDGTPLTKRDRDPGDLIARIVGDTARIKGGLKSVLIHVVQNGLLLLGVFVLLALVNLTLGLMFGAGLLATAGVAWVGTRVIARLARQHRKKEGDYAAKVHRALHESESSAGFRKTNATSARADSEITKIEGYTTWAIHGVLALTTCAILIEGAQSVLDGRLGPADLFTYLAYILMVHNPTVRLGRQMTRLGRMLASAERVAGVFDGRGKPRLTPPTRLVPLAGQIQLRGALLRKRISLKIRRGQRVAIIGGPGDGKTAMLELLAGQGSAHKGEVKWDGLDLMAVRPERRRAEISYLPQAPIWPRRKLRRVAKLPALGDWPAPLFKMVEHSGVARLVAKLPKGLDTVISSFELSPKHRKAFALLGAVQSPASVWLFDDPVGELSARRSAAVLEDLLDLAQGRTIVVTMNKSLRLELFDRVIVMRRGAVRYDGSAADWLERKPRRIA